MPSHAKVSDLHALAPLADARHKELVDRVLRLAPQDGVNDSALSALSFTRVSSPTALARGLHQPCICFVVQGSKRALVGGEDVRYDPLNYLVVSVTMPGCGQVTGASPEQPYLCIRVDIDPQELTRLLLDLGGTRPTPTMGDERALFVARTTEPLLEAVLRLVRLLDEPRDLSVLAPAALREIYYRVLSGELGYRLRDLIESGGASHRITRAIEWLKQHYDQPLRIEDLAAEVHMSPSALHHRFKAVTTFSPLQFQKQLRLHEARRLLLAEGLDCAAAGHRVGYESPSQFSREYRRLFGAPPRQEITRLREATSAAA